MAALILPNRWAQQPQIPVGIDRNNPLTRGIVAAFLPIGEGFDAVNCGSSWTKQGAISKGQTKQGVSSFASGGSAAGRSSQNNQLQSLAECSIFALVVPTAIATVTAFAGCGATGSANPLFIIGTGSGTASMLSFRVRNLSNVNQEVLSASGVLANGRAVAACGVRSESGNFHKVYSDGIEVGSAAASAIGVTAFNTFSVHGLLRNAWGIGCASHLSVAAAWNRALTPIEVKSLSDNPWQIFAGRLT